MNQANHIQWLSKLIHLEIELWDRIDGRLKHEHDLPLAYFEALYNTSQGLGGSLRIGDLARKMRITVGGASKLVDRVEGAGLLRRELDAGDRRASRIVLTDAGRRILDDASVTYETELALILDATLSADEQQLMHSFVTRLLFATDNGN